MPSRRAARESAPELGALGSSDLSSLSLTVSRTTDELGAMGVFYAKEKRKSSTNTLRRTALAWTGHS
uniref:NF-kB RelB splice variant 3 n=1 Tax=Mus musculus TaxID=10090 RepID=Q4U110_MOUSE|nr:NF-kB RelB splice variant 3 [Mus musculus]